MKNLILATTAACGLAIAAVPAFADDHMDGDMMELTAAQQTMYDGWSAENRATYDAWPMAAQEYYWTLNDQQRMVWWERLNDDQRVRIVEMAPAQRAAAWQSINSQLGATTPATTTRTSSAGNMTINYTNNAVVQPTPGDEGPPPANLPICEPNQQDNCINRGAV